MTEEKALEDAQQDFKEIFPNFNNEIVYVEPENIVKGQYKPFCSYAITLENSFIVTDFLVTLTARNCTNDYPYFIYTIYNQALGKEGIYKYI